LRPGRVHPHRGLHGIQRRESNAHESAWRWRGHGPSGDVHLHCLRNRRIHGAHAIQVSHKRNLESDSNNKWLLGRYATDSRIKLLCSMHCFCWFLGMVSVCSGCDLYHPLSGGFMGVLAGCFYLVNSKLMVRLKVDDPVDAVAVHCGSGFLSITLAPILRYHHSRRLRHI
jgi:hypothetical protein